MMKSVRLFGFGLLPLLLASGFAYSAEEAPTAPQPAALVAHPERAAMLAATRAGDRLVAVGDHGVVLLSDDQGISFRQAKRVPTQVMLNAVSFTDAQHGWAAGYDGTILATTDGGDTWTSQRTDYDGDKPLLSIHFEDAQHGMAVGLFGTAVSTDDGGQTWRKLKVAADDSNADRHLFAIFGGRGKPLFIAAEAGLIFRSTDGGLSWQAVQTDNIASFWTGTHIDQGEWLATGLRGHMYRTTDEGLNWSEIKTGTQQSLTQVAKLSDGRIGVTGLLGTLLLGKEGVLVNQPRPQLADLSALLEVPSGLLLFGGQGLQRWN